MFLEEIREKIRRPVTGMQCMEEPRNYVIFKPFPFDDQENVFEDYFDGAHGGKKTEFALVTVPIRQQISFRRPLRPCFFDKVGYN